MTTFSPKDSIPRCQNSSDYTITLIKRLNVDTKHSSNPSYDTDFVWDTFFCSSRRGHVSLESPSEKGLMPEKGRMVAQKCCLTSEFPTMRLWWTPLKLLDPEMQHEGEEAQDIIFLRSFLVWLLTAHSTLHGMHITVNVKDNFDRRDSVDRGPSYSMNCNTSKRYLHAAERSP